jgi:hypothetical protein
MQEHMQTMQENMNVMRGMGGPMTMGGSMTGRCIGALRCQPF